MSSVHCASGNGYSNRVMYSIRLPADSTISRRTPVNSVIDRFRVVAFSPFCMRLLRRYLCIVLDSCGLGVADSTLSFEMEVTNGDPPDVPCSESATGLPLRFDLLTIVSVPAVLPPTSFGDSIADCAGLSSSAKLDSPSSVG